MPVWNFVHKSLYQDSITLLRLAHDLESTPGAQRVAVMMATPANRALLHEAGLLTSDGDGAEPNDLIIAVEADLETIAETCAAQAEARLMARHTPPLLGPVAVVPRTLDTALKQLPGANLVLISVPGVYAGHEALKALRAGLHVMLFSDNVPIETEIKLKRLACDQGLMLMGPDCGTAIIHGVPLGFANAVPRGRIGIAAASGTGLQEVACLIAAAGEGISHAIGVGGRDLSEDVGGLMMQQALAILAADAATAVICLVGKLPGVATWSALQSQLTRLGKPCVVYLGAVAQVAAVPWPMATTLEDTAHIAVALARHATPALGRFTLSDDDIRRLVDTETRRMQPEQRFVRGLYAGGTLAQEAQQLLRQHLVDGDAACLGDGAGHRVVDLGADMFTVGRPHPILDGTLRREWVLQEGRDPTTAVLLLDIVLGYGAHPDPVGELLPALHQVRQEAQAQGRYVAIVASVCGTEQDPQRQSAQIDILRAHGVVVMPSNAQAARLAALLIRAHTPSAFHSED